MFPWPTDRSPTTNCSKLKSSLAVLCCALLQMSQLRVPLRRAGLSASRCYGLLMMRGRTSQLLTTATRPLSANSHTTTAQEQNSQSVKGDDLSRTPAASYGFVRNADPKRQKLLDEILRVDHAGEVGAVNIYAGQMWVLKGTKVQDTLKHMKEGEEVHLSTVKRMMSERRVRPTALLPLWEVAGFALGAATALAGREAAMACTVAVETAISQHYNDQIRQLLAAGSEDKELLSILAKHRDEELEHHDTALGLGAEKAPMYQALSSVIQAGCAAAIQVAKKV